MTMAYPETLLRGLITSSSVTPERYVTVDAFQFQDFRKNRSDNYNEMSINWEDSDEAVDVLLKQKKEGSEDPQFKVGFARMSMASIKDVLRPHISDKSFSYERKPIEGNPFHGNLLVVANLNGQIIKNIRYSLATIATADVYFRSDENIKYLKKNKTMPKVSVIVPVYGVEQYIERCARSLFEQTLDDMEFIFVDDCTPDRSIEVLNRVLEEHPHRKNQVKIVSHENNLGLPFARQSGLKVASGDYIIHCDSDDWVDVTMYEKMYNKAIEEGSDIVVCDYYESDGTVHSWKTQEIPAVPKRFLEKILYHIVPPAVWNKLIRRSCYNHAIQFPSENMGEDLALMTQIVYYSEQISYVQEPLYYYFLNMASISKNPSYDKREKRVLQLVSNVQFIEDFFSRNGVLTRYKEEVSHLKFFAKTRLNLNTFNRRGSELWHSLYPELSLWQVMCLKHTSVKEKLVYFLTYIGVYVLIKRITNSL